MSDTLKKIVYFDETSAINLLQIVKKGNFTKTTELMTTLEGDSTAKVNANLDVGKQSPFKKVFESLTGLSGSFQMGAALDGSFQGIELLGLF